MRTLALALWIWISFQDQPPARRHFEVASIKASTSGQRALQGFTFTGNRFTATNATLVDMIVRVYPTRRIQMQGGPDGIDSERFDVLAKADDSEGEVKHSQIAEMVQTMLEDRFKLAFHNETKEMQVLTLVQGKSSPKLEPAKEGDPVGMTQGEHGQMVFKRMNMQGLVNLTSNLLGVPVVDRTNLAGFYSFTIDPLLLVGADTPVKREDFGDLFVSAVQTQLGMKLEKQKLPLEITVIDRAERPAAN